MRIGEFSRRLGVTPPTVRYYESLGLLAAPGRVSGRRRYGADAMNGLRLVLALKGAGFTLSEIRRLLTTGVESRTREEWQSIARNKAAELELRIHELTLARTALLGALDCRCDGHADRCDLVASTAALARPARRGRGRSR
jgi:DNA-binding transcriptional MerR regulator